MTAAEAVRAACAIINQRRAKRPLVVGIDGLGGAGKSTLANGIDETFAGCVSIIRCDDFYRPLGGEEFLRLTPEEAYESYFDWCRLRDEALMPLREGKHARYQRRDWSTDRFDEWIEVEPREIVIVEGVFSTRPELRSLIDVAVFVETPREERIRRMSVRPQPSTSWMEQWMAAEDWYLAHIAPHWHADLVIEGF
jgi:uridine kinase